MEFRGYNKDDSHEEENEDNPYCLLCKSRKDEDFPHLYGECEALVDLINLKIAKRAHRCTYYSLYKGIYRLN